MPPMRCRASYVAFTALCWAAATILCGLDQSVVTADTGLVKPASQRATTAAVRSKPWSVRRQLQGQDEPEDEPDEPEEETPNEDEETPNEDEETPNEEPNEDEEPNETPGDEEAPNGDAPNEDEDAPANEDEDAPANEDEDAPANENEDPPANEEEDPPANEEADPPSEEDAPANEETPEDAPDGETEAPQDTPEVPVDGETTPVPADGATPAPADGATDGVPSGTVAPTLWDDALYNGTDDAFFNGTDDAYFNYTDDGLWYTPENGIEVPIFVGSRCMSDGSLEPLYSELLPPWFQATFAPESCACLETNRTNIVEDDYIVFWTHFTYDCVNTEQNCFYARPNDTSTEYCGLVEFREDHTDEPAPFWDELDGPLNLTFQDDEVDLSIDIINTESTYLVEGCLTYAETDETNAGDRVCFGQTTEDFVTSTLDAPCYISYNNEQCNSCVYQDGVVNRNGDDGAKCYQADCSNIADLPAANALVDNCACIGLDGPFRFLTVWEGSNITATGGNCVVSGGNTSAVGGGGNTSAVDSGGNASATDSGVGSGSNTSAGDSDVGSGSNTSVGDSDVDSGAAGGGNTSDSTSVNGGATRNADPSEASSAMSLSVGALVTAVWSVWAMTFLG